MPRIGVDLPDFDYCPQVDKEPAACGAGAEEEILPGLVFVGGDPAVVERVDIAAVEGAPAAHDRELGGAGRVVS